MKHINKIVALTLALVLVLGLATTAFAADDYTVTINNAAGHTYQIYQIFTGDLTTNDAGKDVLSNIKYGADYTPTGTKAGDLVPESVLENLNATAITPTGTGTAMTTNGDVATIDGLAAGYYMIKDTTTALPDGDNPSAVIFQVVGDTTVTSKHSGTTIVKKVQDINDSTGEQPKDNGSEWIDSADYDIGDNVPFQSTATFEGLDNYDTYEVVFTDIMAKGLTYNRDMVVLVNGEDMTNSFTIAATDYAGTAGDAYAGGTEITVSCEDLTELTDANAVTIVLQYSATLNKDAKLGAPGNPNKIKVNTEATGKGGNTDKDETPWDVNIVFTYEVEVNKVDENNQPLTGAAFTLEKFIASANGKDEYNGVKGDWTTLELVATENGTVFSFTGLDDGYYRITETQTPAGYNSIDPIYFTVTAEHDIVSDNPALTELKADVVKADGSAYTETELASGNIASFTVTKENGEMKTDVVNKPGTVLPETGGIGTTIFYVIGGVLVLGAAVLLVTKKRMASAE